MSLAMQVDGAVVLYGAGREARSTRQFLATEAPNTKVYVTVDSGDADIENATQITPSELLEKNRKQPGRHARALGRGLDLQT